MIAPINKETKEPIVPGAMKILPNPPKVDIITHIFFNEGISVIFIIINQRSYSCL